MLERKGAVTSNGKPLTALGQPLNPGDPVPGFTVLDQAFQPVTYDPASGKVFLISVMPSLDTGICDAQGRRFNEEAATLGDNVEIWAISADLPQAQKRWCGAAGIDNIKVYSDSRDVDFGNKFGVLIKETRLLSRSVFVIDAEGKVRYAEYVKEIASHPDYEKALAAVKELL
jgi:thiol peroxidase